MNIMDTHLVLCVFRLMALDELHAFSLSP